MALLMAPTYNNPITLVSCVSIVNAASCTIGDKALHCCNGCGNSFEPDHTDYVESLNHSCDAGRIVQNATCTCESLSEFRCIRYNISRLEVNALTGGGYNVARSQNRNSQRLERDRWADSKVYNAKDYKGLKIKNRVGGGDSFASGLIHGLMTTGDEELAVNYGAAHRALAMTTPGDTTMASRKEVDAVMGGAGARVQR